MCLDSDAPMASHFGYVKAIFICLSWICAAAKTHRLNKSTSANLCGSVVEVKTFIYALKLHITSTVCRWTLSIERTERSNEVNTCQSIDCACAYDWNGKKRTKNKCVCVCVWARHDNGMTE